MKRYSFRGSWKDFVEGDGSRISFCWGSSTGTSKVMAPSPTNTATDAILPCYTLVVQQVRLEVQWPCVRGCNFSCGDLALTLNPRPEALTL